MVFVFVYSKKNCSNLSFLSVCIDTYQSDMCHLRNSVIEQVAFTPWASLHDGLIPRVLSICFLVSRFFHHFCLAPCMFGWSRVVLQPSTSRTCFSGYYTCCTAVVLYDVCIPDLACLYLRRLRTYDEDFSNDTWRTPPDTTALLMASSHHFTHSHQVSARFMPPLWYCAVLFLGWYEEGYIWLQTPNQSFLEYIWYFINLNSYLFRRPPQQLILTKTFD